MDIPSERIHEFMTLYKEEFNKTITEDEAEVMMIECLQLLKFLAKPLPSEIETRKKADMFSRNALIMFTISVNSLLFFGEKVRTTSRTLPAGRHVASPKTSPPFFRNAQMISFAHEQKK